MPCRVVQFFPFRCCAPLYHMLTVDIPWLGKGSQGNCILLCQFLGRLPEWSDGLFITAGIDGRWWLSPDCWRALFEWGQSLSQAGEWADQAKRRYTAENASWMMRYAVNRPQGGLRGEGDLSPLLT